MQPPSATSSVVKEQPPVPAHIQRRQLKELEEYRKVGLAAPAVDIVSGQEISPHIPSHLATAPWYMKEFQKNAEGGALTGGRSGGLTLAHHRTEKTDDSVFKEDFEQALVAVDNGNKQSTLSSMLFATGKEPGTTGPTITKYRPGACTNCGSMSHKASACIKPKRKVGALYTNKIEGKDFITVKKTDLLALEKGPDGTITAASQQLLSQAETDSQKLSYEQKKASWSKKELSFEKSEEIHTATQRKLEDAASFEARRQEETAAEQQRLANKLPRQQLAKRVATISGASSLPSSALAGSTGDTSIFAGQTSELTTSTNSDLAFLPKYLENIDEENVYYDPRSRSFRGNPNANKYKNIMSMEANTGGHSLGQPTLVDAAATSAANTYKGDNARTRTEGYYSYMEQVSSFAKGETRSFANLHSHEEKERERRAQQEKVRAAVRKAELTQKALYGIGQPGIEQSSSIGPITSAGGSVGVIDGNAMGDGEVVGQKRERMYQEREAENATE
eukprot:Tbor_TRINITY_DN5382_c7_g1::TRINITY_DN5382_c7_g1_i1::g.4272::m.4272/K12819/SLU7; pre-mRNA-processing factor SLU7